MKVLSLWWKTIASGTYLNLQPILFKRNDNSVSCPLKKLSSKGIKKFISFEVPEEIVKKRYGSHYDVILDDIKQEDDLRVIDFDGHHIYDEFSLKDLGEPTFYET